MKTREPSLQASGAGLRAALHPSEPEARSPKPAAQRLAADARSQRPAARSLKPEAGNPEWVPFPGGELEGRPPTTLCPACRKKAEEARSRSAQDVIRPRTLCFHCYRTEFESRARGTIRAPIQSGLPFEPVNLPRLRRLKIERLAERARHISQSGEYTQRVRTAQIAARRALQSIEAAASGNGGRTANRRPEVAAAIRAAELQLPESWIPFVVSR